MKRRRYYLLSLVFIIYSATYAQRSQVSIQVDATKTVGEMRPFWTYFGYDEPNYTYRRNGKKLLKELAQLSPATVYIRTHNLLTSKGKSTGPDLKWGFTDAYREDSKGNPVYNWTIVDSIIDVFVANGMKPLMEIGFMPEALSVKPTPYEHRWSQRGNLWTGWTYPPKDYNKWRDLVYAWVKHSIDRYGKDEVATWLWEVWNEPDIGYWSGSFEEYCKLYDYAADGLKKACSECTIGGPHTTSPRNEKAYNYLVRFIEHCLRGKNFATGKTGSPLEYIGFHAKGDPVLIDGHVRMNMGAQLKDIDRAFQAINSFPELKNIPVIIGECDPEGCAACSEQREPRYGYRNGTMYSAYTAASFARIYELMDRHKVNLHGVVSWSFEFEDQDWFAGFRDLATNGIDKPVLNIFRMFGLMSGNRVVVTSTGGLNAAGIIGGGVRAGNDVHALAAVDRNTLSVMIWNYHDDYLEDTSQVTVQLNIKTPVDTTTLLQHFRVDEVHSNSFEAWKKSGRPQQVNDSLYALLGHAGQLSLYDSPQWVKPVDGILKLHINLPRRAVTLLRFTWSQAEGRRYQANRK